jgi:hypothetical protein
MDVSFLIIKPGRTFGVQAMLEGALNERMMLGRYYESENVTAIGVVR